MCMAKTPKVTQNVTPPPAEAPTPLASPYGEDEVLGLSQLRFNSKNNLKLRKAGGSQAGGSQAGGNAGSGGTGGSGGGGSQTGGGGGGGGGGGFTQPRGRLLIQ
jgi:hypothetical protein